MTKSATKLAIHTIGLDIAKNSFALHGFDAEGHTVLAKVTVTGYGDVVDGARSRHLMCQDGSVEATNEGAIHHDEVCHKNGHPHNRS